MNIVYKGLEEIRPYAKNPRNNDGAVEAVANSIKEFGFRVPIIIDKNGEIVAGHTRYKASMRLGLTEVPCIIADDLTEDQIRAFRIADNKTSELASWDFPILNEELSEIKIDMKDFGFLDAEINDDYVQDFFDRGNEHVKKDEISVKVICKTEEEADAVSILLEENGYKPIRS